ncbi:hypothetical protein ACLK17_01275 [Escherichia coli]
MLEKLIMSGAFTVLGHTTRR